MSNSIPRNLTFRLPTVVRPKHYQLTLHPNLKGCQFNGIVIITINVLKSVSYIVVHTKKLDIFDTKIFRENGNLVSIGKTWEYPEWEYWIIELDECLHPGCYVLEMSFKGHTIGKIVGFYKSTYFNEETQEKRSLVGSKFQPTYARQAFPCFDEPNMKATYAISLIRPTGDNYIALSNMMEERTEDRGETTTVFFQTSVPMSTYLSVYLICDFQCREVEIEAPIGHNFPLKVYATPPQQNKLQYALDLAVDCIRTYIGYFQIEYPLPKLDLAAIPDYVSSATEHWGLVTFREAVLLVDEGMSSTTNQQRVAESICHELAHMWFGNLVTCDWWNEIWLNEGFATHLQYKILDVIRPDWKIQDQFISNIMHRVFLRDATLATHPIVQPVSSPDEITAIFDIISYFKGSSILRMVEDFVGEERFRQGVTNYLNNHKYDCATTDDLLNELSTIVGEGIDIRHIVATWIEQSGFPLVTVQDSVEGTFTLSQKRFLSNPANVSLMEASKHKYLWYIPITYITDVNQREQREWLTDHENLVIRLPDKVKWIKFNRRQVGYYRVNYSTKMWDALTDALIHHIDLLHPMDRANLLDDAFNLAANEEIDYTTALTLTKYLFGETELVPWKVAHAQILSLKKLLYYTDTYSLLMEYGRCLVRPIYNKVGWNIISGDVHPDKLLRSVIIQLACELNLEECVQEAGNQFLNYLSNPSERPHPDVRDHVYFYGMERAGDEKQWNALWEIYLMENDAQEKLKLMSGLAAIKTPWILRRYIEYAYDDKYVRRQDYVNCMDYICHNPIGPGLVWDYIRENWDLLVTKFSLNDRYFGSLVPIVCENFCTKIRIDEMEAFYARYPNAGAGAAGRKLALEKVKGNVKWLATYTPKIKQWLEANISKLSQTDEISVHEDESEINHEVDHEENKPAEEEDQAEPEEENPTEENEDE